MIGLGIPVGLLLTTERPVPLVHLTRARSEEPPRRTRAQGGREPGTAPER